MSYERRVGAFVKKERAKSNLSYAAFARKLGISHTTLSRIESNQQGISLKLLQSILRGLNASLQDIIGADEVVRKHGRRG
ncbi:MAG: helix-turn-helix transcriptional regulator [Chthoniobacterales bacterium]